ncbi:MAG: hypothetical protein J6V25_02085 [Oscillospiraceae bacterium]|nr:hypothetical protein [Oscillospiraceae bacterium]
MTQTELYRKILTNLGGDCSKLTDNLDSTLLEAIANTCGGGSGGGGAYVVRFNSTDGVTATCDKTFAEIYEAAKTMNVLGVMDVGNSITHIRFITAIKDFCAVFAEEMPIIGMDSVNGFDGYQYAMVNADNSVVVRMINQDGNPVTPS